MSQIPSSTFSTPTFSKKHPITTSPTYASSMMADSLTLFSPQASGKKSADHSSLIPKQPPTEYKSNFSPFSDKVNTLTIEPRTSNFGKYVKNQSDLNNRKNYLQSYGANILGNSIDLNASQNTKKN